ncbi:hypothetical protein [Umezawaea sp.]|uniref:hypothetical protein n=1 Tax=Umezawaea sp. TaxID=1955258 RepID=UPI002ED49194
MSAAVDGHQAEANTFPILAPRDGKHHLGEVSFEEAVTVPMLLARNVEEIDPPLARRYMRDDMPTREIVVWRGEPSPVWTEPTAQPLPAWFREPTQRSTLKR